MGDSPSWVVLGAFSLDLRRNKVAEAYHAAKTQMAVVAMTALEKEDSSWIVHFQAQSAWLGWKTVPVDVAPAQVRGAEVLNRIGYSCSLESLGNLLAS